MDVKAEHVQPSRERLGDEHLGLRVLEAAALSAGGEIIRLRRSMPRLGLGSEPDPAFAALAHGNSALATARLARLDHLLAARPGAEPEIRLALRARTNILAISEALTEHAAYFDAGARG